MENIPAVWQVAPEADREKVEDVVSRLADQLGIEKPEVGSNSVLLPANYPQVAQALDEVEPGWRDETLLIPPEP
jgi:hypothetical protein